MKVVVIKERADACAKACGRGAVWVAGPRAAAGGQVVGEVFGYMGGTAETVGRAIVWLPVKAAKACLPKARVSQQEDGMELPTPVPAGEAAQRTTAVETAAAQQATIPAELAAQRTLAKESISQAVQANPRLAYRPGIDESNLLDFTRVGERKVIIITGGQGEAKRSPLDSSAMQEQERDNVVAVASEALTEPTRYSRITEQSGQTGEECGAPSQPLDAPTTSLTPRPPVRPSSSVASSITSTTPRIRGLTAPLRQQEVGRGGRSAGGGKQPA